MNNKKLIFGVVGALLTAGGAILSLFSDVMPDKKKEEKEKEDE